MSSAPVLEPSGARDTADAAARVARLFERHGRMVYGVCRAMLRDPHEAEDATQQAYLSAYRALLSGARVRDEGAWLATIARNECRGRISAGMRSPLLVPDEDLPATRVAADEEERRAHVEALRDALAGLPERQREAAVLRHVYGLRHGEVATALGLSRPATEALLFRARRTLRQRLRPLIATTLAVPLSVQEALAQAIPGFTGGGSSAAVAGVAGGGVLAKLAAAPAGAKLATAAVAVTTVGTVGSLEAERPGRAQQKAGGPSVAAVAPEARDEERARAAARIESARSGSAGVDSAQARRGSDGGGSGTQSGRESVSDDRGNDSGHGSGRSGSGDENLQSPAPEDDALDGDEPHGDESGSGGSGPSASGSGSGSGDDEPDSDSGERDDSSGPSSSSGHSSSGPGSGDETEDGEEEGAGEDESESDGDSSGSGGSGGSDGEGDDADEEDH